MNNINVQIKYKTEDKEWVTKHPETNIHQVIGLQDQLDFIGNANDLKTSHKNTLVGAINEVYTMSAIEKSSDTITIAHKNSGQVADVLIDDTECIGDVVNNIIAKQVDLNKKQVTIQLLNGRFKLTTPIIIKDIAVTLQGNSRDTVVYVSRSSAEGKIDFAIDIQQGDTIIQDLDIDCQSNADTAIKSTKLDVLIKGVHVSNMEKTGINCLGRLTIDNCKVSNSYGKATSGLICNGFITVKNTQIDGIRGDGVFVRMKTDILNCTIEQCNVGVLLRGATTIRDSLIKNCPKGIVSESESYIENTTVIKSSTLAVDANVNTTINHCHIKNNRDFAARVRHSSTIKNTTFESLWSMQIECLDKAIFTNNEIIKGEDNKLIIDNSFTGVCSHNVILNGEIEIIEGAKTDWIQYNLVQGGQ